MGLRPQASFSAGELDPRLQERTTLQKYKTGLNVARNVCISKTGSIISRFARKYFAQTNIDDSYVRLYSPPASGYLMEWGHLYVRVYDSSGTVIATTVTTITRSELDLLHFETSGLYVYVFQIATAVKKIYYLTGTFVTGSDIFKLLVAPTAATWTGVGVPAGYYVDYAFTYVKNGEESLYFEKGGANTNKVPIAAGQSGILVVTLGTSAALGTDVTEMRVYRRPQSAGAYGYIGTTSNLAIIGADLVATFTDFGGDADYAHTPPQLGTTSRTAPIDLLPATGAVYQQRLLITELPDTEAINASRTGYENNFMRDYPIGSDSALKFKAKSSGKATVLRMIERDGLVVFTRRGVFINQGPLAPDNLALTKKGGWVIDRDLHPIIVPGALLFVDATTNTVRNFKVSEGVNGEYVGEEVSIFSDHLFLYRKITSWAFQNGAFPILWVVFNDGTFASFTYEQDQEMRAWTRHDSTVTVESVCETGVNDTSYFVVKVGTKRYIEKTVARYANAATFAADSEADKGTSCAFLDSFKSYNGLLSAGASTFTLEKLESDWSQTLRLKCGTAAVFTDPGPGAVGNILRVFDDEGTVYDLEVIAWINHNEVTVQPAIEYDEDMASGFRLYLTASTLSGLDHMEGESVSVIIDGAIAASPNNDEQSYPEVLVTGGAVTLPYPGAIFHVGRPITADVQTLDIDTIEQGPTLIESMTINKLYLKVFNTLGLYASYKFPLDNKVSGMENVDQYVVDYEAEEPIIANRYKTPTTKRVEVSLPGDWRSNGKIAIRQADPMHFEILSIIPDAELLQRGG